MDFRAIRQSIYDYHKDNYSYIFRWPWYSYRKYKLMFSFECASILIFILLKTAITPNMITVFYIVLNICSGILLALPLKTSVLIAALILFFKPILDSVDGSLARIKNQSSITGDVLDDYGGLMGWVIMWAGLGIYLGNSMNNIFYYLAPVLPVLFAVDLYASAKQRFIHHYFIKPKFRSIEDNRTAVKGISSDRRSLIRITKEQVDKFFEPNYRTIDIICLMLLIELFSSARIFWLFYCAFFVWKIMTFCLRLYVASCGGWAENEFENLRKNLYA